MADDKKNNDIPSGLGPETVYPKGRPVSLNDIMSEDIVEYARTPGFTPGQVFVTQTLTAGDLIEWSEASEGSEQKRLAGLRLIIKATVDGEPGVDPGAKGIPIMSEAHMEFLRKKKHKTTETVVKHILKQNGMRVKGDSDAKND